MGELRTRISQLEAEKSLLMGQLSGSEAHVRFRQRVFWGCGCHGRDGMPGACGRPSHGVCQCKCSPKPQNSVGSDDVQTMGLKA